MRRARTDQPGGELVHVGLADEQRSGLLQATNHCGALRRRKSIRGAASGCGHAGHVEIVFHRKGLAGQGKVGRVFQFSGAGNGGVTRRQ